LPLIDDASRGGDWDRETGPAEGDLRPDTRARLVCRQSGRTDVVELADGEEVLFGRSDVVTIRVEDIKASRRHVRVRLVGGTFHVQDLGSRNGTLLNGRTLGKEECALVTGGVVRIGDCEIILATASPGPRGDLSSEPEGEGVTEDIVIADPEMHKVAELARKVARSNASVLLLGETGVGKDVFARRIHAGSTRADKPFVRLNCGAIPGALFESQLFGHERGAFTGADRKRDGLVHTAHGGTLFLDEIGELSLAEQVKLLHLLENRTFVRIGGTTEIAADVRVICATHRDLQADVDSGRFRADLYYRISSFVITVPPLRTRPREIVVMAYSFTKALASRAGENVPDLSRAFIESLSGYAWPGNVRELRNAVEHAMVVAEGATLEVEHLPAALTSAAAPASSPLPGIQRDLAARERESIEAAIEAEGGNQTRAALRLGMSRRTLVYKLARWRREG
jgi:two-component system response regulator AtoC